MGEWILFQNQDNSDRMGAAVFTSGPYIEMASSPLAAMTTIVEDGVVTWRVPLGQGAIPHVAHEDCGYPARWILDHPERSNGMNLEVAIAHMTYTDIAEAFQKVTGHPAQYIDTDLDPYWNGPLKGLADLPAGYNADPNDKSTVRLPRQLHTGFWNVRKYGKVSRNYDVLDEIQPNRIRSAEHWFRREDQLGRELGKGTLWDRVQPENQTIDSAILKGSADLRTSTL